MRNTGRLILGLAALLFTAACDSPVAVPDLDAPIQENSVDCGSESDPCQLPPAGNDPGDSDPVCDPYLTLNGCEDECVEGTPGGPETAGVEGCWDSGGGGGGGGGDLGGGGGDGGGGDGDGSPPPCPESEPECTPSFPPEGIEQEYWNSLNPTERRMCWEGPRECHQVYLAKTAAEQWAAQQEPVGAQNGPQDAMRHAYWNAHMTQSIGAARASAWGDAHEESSTDAAETRMDLYNNAVGRHVGVFWSDIGAGIWYARNNGQMCLWVGQC